MPDLSRMLTVGAKAGLGLCLLVGLTAPGFADAMHFMNGKVVQGKLARVTGDLIEFREGSGFGNKMNIHRIELSNRHDIVEVRGGKRYFGEIVYQDKFKLDLRTATGLIKLNRLKITDVVLGSPTERPVSTTDVMPTAPQPGNLSADKPLVQFPVGSEPLPGQPSGSSADDEDWDAIPAVNR